MTGDFLQFQNEVIYRRGFLWALVSTFFVGSLLILWMFPAWINLARNLMTNFSESIDELLKMIILSTVIILISLVSIATYAIFHWRLYFQYYSKTFKTYSSYRLAFFGSIISLIFGFIWQTRFSDSYILEAVWYFDITVSCAAFIALISYLTTRHKMGLNDITLPNYTFSISLGVKRIILVSLSDALRHSIVTIFVTFFLANFVNNIPFGYNFIHNTSKDFKLQVSVLNCLVWAFISSSFVVAVTSFTLSSLELIMLQPLNFSSCFRRSKNIPLNLEGDILAENYLLTTLKSFIVKGLLDSVGKDSEFEKSMFDISSTKQPIWQRALEDQRKWTEAMMLGCDKVTTTSGLETNKSKDKLHIDLFSYRKIQLLFLDDKNDSLSSWFRIIIGSLAWKDFSLIARSSPERRKAIFSGFIDGHKILKVVSYSVCSLTDAMTLQLQIVLAKAVVEVFKPASSGPFYYKALDSETPGQPRNSFEKRWNGDIPWESLGDETRLRRMTIEADGLLNTIISSVGESHRIFNPLKQLYFGSVVEEYPFSIGLVQQASYAIDGLSLLLKRALMEDRSGFASEFVPLTLSSFIALALAIDEFQEMLTSSLKIPCGVQLPSGISSLAGRIPSLTVCISDTVNDILMNIGVSSKELQTLSSIIDEAINRLLISYVDLLPTFALQEIYQRELSLRLARLQR